MTTGPIDRGQARQAGQDALQPALLVLADLARQQRLDGRVADAAQAEERQQQEGHPALGRQADGDVGEGVEADGDRQRLALAEPLGDRPGHERLRQGGEHAEAGQREADRPRIPGELVLAVEHPDRAADLTDDRPA
jgi:hypothetical protein